MVFEPGTQTSFEAASEAWLACCPDGMVQSADIVQICLDNIASRIPLAYASASNIRRLDRLFKPKEGQSETEQGPKFLRMLQPYHQEVHFLFFWRAYSKAAAFITGRASGLWEEGLLAEFEALRDDLLRALAEDTSRAEGPRLVIATTKVVETLNSLAQASIAPDFWRHVAESVLSDAGAGNAISLEEVAALVASWHRDAVGWRRSPSSASTSSTAASSCASVGAAAAPVSAPPTSTCLLTGRKAGRDSRPRDSRASVREALRVETEDLLDSARVGCCSGPLLFAPGPGAGGLNGGYGPRSLSRGGGVEHIWVEHFGDDTRPISSRSTNTRASEAMAKVQRPRPPELFEECKENMGPSNCRIFPFSPKFSPKSPLQGLATAMGCFCLPLGRTSPMGAQKLLRENGHSGLPVFLHIYDVSQEDAVKKINSFLASRYSPFKLGGIFHAGIEVGGMEWSFGFTEQDTTPGVCCHEPRGHPDHSFRQSIPLKRTPLTQPEIAALIGRLVEEYPGSTYDLLRNNCCHFAEDFATRLGAGKLPGWVHRLARIGAAADGAMQVANALPSKVRNVLQPTSDAAQPRAGGYSAGPAGGFERVRQQPVGLASEICGGRVDRRQLSLLGGSRAESLPSPSNVQPL